ncbi:hypothetical protein PybrP1_004164 [[Pythium] brassicae (nom. inval.)]|nr:hypothetical protein PybrP1_004164 [[Pythium] brassicae (nom. inval.)]
MLAGGKWLVAALVATAALGAAAGAAFARRRQPEVERALRQEVARQQQLRAQERSGRTSAERDAREALQQQQREAGYAFEAVATVQSCFGERRGTPRQGVLVPAARARLEFRASVPAAALEGLEQFSHLWVLFVFHENTNAAKAMKAARTFPAKITPPRLGGRKVGLFSTRTPHRPNAIGLSLVKIDAVRGRVLEISGHDLVDGTPVLDVKPYTFADCVPTHTCPEWVSDSVDLARRVEFSAPAARALDEVVRLGRSRFYQHASDLRAAITQTLVLDIRSVHQGRGHAVADQRFLCRFDNVQVAFSTLEDKILVVECSYSPKE